MAYQYVHVNSFQANNPGWNLFGNVSSVAQQGGSAFQLFSEESNVSLMLYVLSDRAFRLRFNPTPGFVYPLPTDGTVTDSLAVVNRNLGSTASLKVTRSDTLLTLDLGTITVQVELRPYRLSVYRGSQLIHQDVAGTGKLNAVGQVNQNLIYAKGGSAVANLKQYPANAKYVGFGEKAGFQLLKNECTMTFFNYNNFKYSTGPVPPGSPGGPLDPSEPLYTSIPLTIEFNPQPTGTYAGAPYAYALFLDNVSQSYFNVGKSDYSNMYGRYYFGALYGELDYYFMAGDDVPSVLSQYVTLTGAAPLPPKYVFGFHQGAYGYYNNAKLLNVAETYRKWQIPIDGLHIDVDFQNNYRTFTSSALKFPNPKAMFALLKGLGFKCSTNITGMVTANPYDETGQVTAYDTVTSGRKGGMFIHDTTSNSGENPNLFVVVYLFRLKL